MNRRSFFKAVTGFVVGVFAAKKSKADVTIFPTEEQARKVSLDIYGDPDKLYCRGKNGTLCPRCSFNCKSTAIDPNSEWAKQKPLTLTKLESIKEKIDQMERLRIEAVLKTAYKAEYAAYVFYPNGEIEPIHYQELYKTV